MHDKWATHLSCACHTAELLLYKRVVALGMALSKNYVSTYVCYSAPLTVLACQQVPISKWLMQEQEAHQVAAAAAAAAAAEADKIFSDADSDDKVPDLPARPSAGRGPMDSYDELSKPSTSAGELWVVGT